MTVSLSTNNNIVILIKMVIMSKSHLLKFIKEIESILLDELIKQSFFNRKQKLNQFLSIHVIFYYNFSYFFSFCFYKNVLV